jgi:hypothetical protein
MKLITPLHLMPIQNAWSFISTPHIHPHGELPKHRENISLLII